MGTEATLFQRGFIKGWDHTQRIHHPSLRELVKSGRLSQSLNAFLRAANEAAREVFQGPVTYSSVVPIEMVERYLPERSVHIGVCPGTSAWRVMLVQQMLPDWLSRFMDSQPPSPLPST